MAMVDRSLLRQAYAYWFGAPEGPEAFPADKAGIWFAGGEEVDTHIRTTFGPHLRAAADHPWDVLNLSRQEQVGLVVLLDQFPRNSYRDSGEAFACDSAARAIAKRLIDNGINRFLWVERPFLLLPLEHSETFEDQEQSVRLFRALCRGVPETLRAFATQALDYAIKHYAIIARFDRFPHRNAALGRTSTPDEEAFLKEHGRGF